MMRIICYLYRRDLTLVSEKNRERFQLWNPSHYDPSSDELTTIFPNEEEAKAFLEEEKMTQQMFTLNKDEKIIGTMRSIVELPN